jgi:hypothetical protein
MIVFGLFRYVLAVAIGIVLSYYWWSMLENYYLVRIDYKRRDKLQHDLSLFSETGFYYSFYEQFAFADEWRSGLNLLYNDSLSEHPDTVNALVRTHLER